MATCIPSVGKIMTYYHAWARILGGHQTWRNMSLSDLIRDVLVPFVNHHVSTVGYGRTDAVMNLGTVTYLRIFQTAVVLPDGDPIDQLETECTDEVLRRAHIEYAWPKARSVLQATLAPKQHRVFVVMTFGDPALDGIYRDVIKPLINAFDFDVLRIDDGEDSGNINEQLLHALTTSELILCDLTGERPNCYYETGFAHALGRELILTIRDDQQTIPFDLASHRFIRWSDADDLRLKLQERFKAIAERRSGFEEEPSNEPLAADR